MRKPFAVLLLMLLLPGLVAAARYRQPAYITNVYFANQPERVDGFVQPDRVFNKLKAKDPNVVAYLVLNLVSDKGVHEVDIEILDRDGKRFDQLKFAPVTADRDDWSYTATGRFGGELPEGGIFFKIWDRLDKGERVNIGTFRLMTATW